MPNYFKMRVSEEPSEEEQDLYIMVVCVILILYVAFQQVIEHKKITLIHETGLGILLGILFGLLLYEKHFILNFKGEYFFTYILPPIIFAGGYNLKKDKFFQNIFYIALYAIFGTIINFLITLFIMIGFNNQGWIYTSDGEQVKMNDANILYFSSTMCASDAIAALTLISADKYPKLLSIVFGEGLLNDAVAIILFHSVSKIATPDGSSISTKDAFEMIWNFITTCLASVSLGVVVGVLCTFLFRKCRIFYHNAVAENVLIFLFGFSCYVMVEALDQSGVISLLTCAIIMSHYLQYNLSPSGVITSGVTLQTLSQIVEGFLFVYLGISFWFYFSPDKFDDTSMGFIGFGFLAVLVARICCIFGTSGLAYLIKKKSWNLNIWEISIVWFAGLIRGAVAFALIQTVYIDCAPGDSLCEKQNQILKSSIMAIVFFTTIVLGAFMPCYVNFHIKKIDQLKVERLESDASQIQETLIQKTAIEENDETQQERIQQFSENKEAQLKKKYSGCIRLFKMLDENFVKPFLIYDYENRKLEIHKQKKILKKNQSFVDGNMQVRTLARIQNTVLTHSMQENNLTQFDRSTQQQGGEYLSQSAIQARKITFDVKDYKNLNTEKIPIVNEEEEHIREEEDENQTEATVEIEDQDLDKETKSYDQKLTKSKENQKKQDTKNIDI